MLQLNQLNVMYSFWTQNDQVISASDLTNWFSKQQLGYRIVDSPMDTSRYYTILDAGGSPLLLLGFHQSPTTPLTQEELRPREATASQPEAAQVGVCRPQHSSFLASKYHYDILFEPTKGLQKVMASLHLLYALSSLREGAILDLKAQRIVSARKLQKTLARETILPEDHIALQFVVDHENGISWLHSHGMEKFDLPNLETFDLTEENLLSAIQLFNDLALAMIEGHSPPPNAPIELPGGKITLMFSHDVRQFLSETYGSLFKEHKGASYSVIDFEQAGDINAVVANYFTAKYFGPDAHPIVERQEIERVLTKKSLALDGVVFFLCLSIDSREYGRGNLWIEATGLSDGLITGRILVSGLSNKMLGKGDTIEFSFDEILRLYATAGDRLLTPQELFTLTKDV